MCRNIPCSSPNVSNAHMLMLYDGGVDEIADVGLPGFELSF